MVDEGRITARDIMQTDVIQLDPLMPVQSAVETFEEYSISGAPVVNESGELVGALSATDIVKASHVHNGEIEVRKKTFYEADPLEEVDDSAYSIEDYEADVLDRKTVADWMTARVISIRPDATLSEVCALMVKEEIHRVFVVEEGRLLGIVSTFDVVRYVADPKPVTP